MLDQEPDEYQIAVYASLFKEGAEFVKRVSVSVCSHIWMLPHFATDSK